MINLKINDKIGEINRLARLIKNNDEYNPEYISIREIHALNLSDGKKELYWSKQQVSGGFITETDVFIIAESITEKMANKTLDMILIERQRKLEEIRENNLKHAEQVAILLDNKE